MRYLTILIILICAFFFSCGKKDKTSKGKVIYASYDIPFEISPIDTVILKDTYYQNGELKLFFKGYSDNRATKNQCASSTGFTMYLYISLESENRIPFIDTLRMPGCTSFDDSEISIVSPQGKISNERTILHLYKVLPRFPELATTPLDYKIKFVFLRK